MKCDPPAFTNRQWNRVAILCAKIAQLGTRLRADWSAHPASPYLIERLAYRSAVAAGADEGEPIDHHVLYAKLFEAKPEGCRLKIDFGASMQISKTYEETLSAWRNFAPFHPQRPLPSTLRAMNTDDVAPPIAAMERAREYRRKHYPEETACLEAQRILHAAGMFPDAHLPLAFPVPRLRADGDWMIGALRRLANALEDTTDVLDAATAFMARGAETLGPELRKDAGAIRALPVLAGRPALRQDALKEALGVSKKAAISALKQLEDAGLAAELTGNDSWQVWTANDPVLGLPGRADHAVMMPLPGGKMVTVA